MSKVKKHQTTFDELKRIALADPDVRNAYEKADQAWQLKELIIEARERANLTQSDVAKKLNIRPSSICRFEKNPTKANIQTILNYLDACGAKLDIHLSY